MKDKYWYPAIFLSVMLLLPVMFFPVSTDLSIFITGGRSIAEGGRIYVDYIDLKPPFLYYIFAGIYKIFGWQEFGIRVFDFIWQALTSLSLYFIVRRLTGSQTTGLFTLAIYAFSYSTLQFMNTMQVESLVCLPLAWITYLQFRKSRNIAAIAIEGALIGLIAGMKYTLLIILPVILLDELLNKPTTRFKSRVKNTIVLLISAFFIFAVSHFPLLNPEVRKGFSHVLEFLTFYSNIQGYSTGFIKDAIKNIGSFFGVYYTHLLVAGIGVGAYHALNGSKAESDKELSRFIKFNIIMAIALLISVISEKKFPPYHYSRLYIELSIVSGAGLCLLWNAARSAIAGSNFYNKMIICVLIVSSLAVSPLPRWLALIDIPASYFKGRDNYDQKFETAGDFNFARLRYRKAAEVIKKELKPEDKVVIMGIGINPIYHLIDAKKVSVFAHSSFHLSAIDIPEWDSLAVKDLKDAKWLIIQRNYIIYGINGHHMDALTSMLHKEHLSLYIRSNFAEYRSFPDYIIMKRI